MTPGPCPPPGAPAAPQPLLHLVDLLHPGLEPRPSTLRPALQALAHWRLACGDLDSAARWQRLAATGCHPALLRQQLQPLLEPYPALAAQLQAPVDWRPLQRALQRGHYARAEHLQNELLHVDPRPQQQQPIALLISLLEAWLQAGRWTAALQLLQHREVLGLTPGLVDDSDLCRSTAWLLEQQGHAEWAAAWQLRLRELSGELSRELSDGSR